MAKSDQVSYDWERLEAPTEITSNTTDQMTEEGFFMSVGCQLRTQHGQHTGFTFGTPQITPIGRPQKTI